MSKVFTVGDIHGCHKGLVQALQRASFNYEEDTLITLGDVVDGWGDSYEVVEELLKIKNRIDIRGNHDYWFYEFIMIGLHRERWGHGGIATATSYGKNLLGDKFEVTDVSVPVIDMAGNKTMHELYNTTLVNSDIPQSHVKFFMGQRNYYVDHERNFLFVHGGFNRHNKLADQFSDDIFFWDRDLWLSAMAADRNSLGFTIKEKFNLIFIGHTSTVNWGLDVPMQARNIINIDTGGGFNGKITVMNVDTQEAFQSDLVQTLYPEEKGRN